MRAGWRAGLAPSYGGRRGSAAVMCLLLGPSGVGKTLLVKRLLTILPRRRGSGGGRAGAGRGGWCGRRVLPGARGRGSGAGCGRRPPSPPGSGSLTARTAELRGWEGRPGRPAADAAHGRPPRSRRCGGNERQSASGGFLGKLEPGGARANGRRGAGRPASRGRAAADVGGRMAGPRGDPHGWGSELPPQPTLGLRAWISGSRFGLAGWGLCPGSRPSRTGTVGFGSAWRAAHAPPRSSQWGSACVRRALGLFRWAPT